MKSFFLYIIGILLCCSAHAQHVLSIEVNGSINPASANFIAAGIQKARDEKAQCLIIRLNTPGGLLKSTRVIVSDILASPVPIVVYVSPQGAHAGSAGVFITMAAHIAVMAPSTNIGAAHPVNMQGGMDSVANEKATNDAAAFIRAIARQRNRNFEWAEEAVRQSVSITAQEAFDGRIIDLIARNEADLLRKIDGKTVEADSLQMKLNTAGATIRRMEMSFAEKFLDMISDPNVAYILMMLGFYGILFEVYSPGAVAPGVVGAICLILAFYSMHTLPLNYAGVALIALGMILFILEINVTSHGILTIGGVIALGLGSMMLIRTESALEVIRISWSVILSATVGTALFFSLLLALVVRAQRRKPVSGAEGIVGEEGITTSSLNPTGTVKVHGEIWKATSVSGVIEPGTSVRVTAIEDLTVYVEPVSPTPS